MNAGQGINKEIMAAMMITGVSKKNKETDRDQAPVHVTRDKGMIAHDQVHQNQSRLDMTIRNALTTRENAEEKTILNHARGHNNQHQASLKRQARALVFVTGRTT